jgi:hypothetical protein
VFEIAAALPRGDLHRHDFHGTQLLAANNLSDLQSASAARSNLGLGSAALANTGGASGNVPLLGSGGMLAASAIPSGLTLVGANTSGPGTTGDYNEDVLSSQIIPANLFASSQAAGSPLSSVRVNFAFHILSSGAPSKTMRIYLGPAASLATPNASFKIYDSGAYSAASGTATLSGDMVITWNGAGSLIVIPNIAGVFDSTGAGMGAGFNLRKPVAIPSLTFSGGNLVLMYTMQDSGNTPAANDAVLSSSVITDAF